MDLYGARKGEHGSTANGDFGDLSSKKSTACCPPLTANVEPIGAQAVSHRPRILGEGGVTGDNSRCIRRVDLADAQDGGTQGADTAGEELAPAQRSMAGQGEERSGRHVPPRSS
jgi:hypothetical protein